jgi:hypothetical protein
MLLVLAALTSCKDKSPAPKQQTEVVAPTPIDAAAPVDAPPDAATAARPTKEQALAAGKRWIAAAAGKDPKALVAASHLPFALTDEYNNPSCAEDPLADGDAFTKAARCLQNAKLRATLGNQESLHLEASDEVPDPAATIEAYRDRWSGLVAPADLPTHMLVSVFGNHPKYPADVLYALLSVRLDGAEPIVDGAVLVFASEGD